MVGAFLGPWGVFLTVFCGSILGSLAGLGLVLARKGGLRTAIPFGVFLAVGAVATYFFGGVLLDGVPLALAARLDSAGRERRAQRGFT